VRPSGLVSQVYDADGDGSPDNIDWYYYNEEGRLDRSDTDTDADGDIDRIASHKYDENGNMGLCEVDLEANGTVDYTVTHSYDEQGRRQSSIIEREHYPWMNTEQYFAYDAAGNLLVVSQYRQGVPANRVAYDYDCQETTGKSRPVPTVVPRQYPVWPSICDYRFQLPRAGSEADPVRCPPGGTFLYAKRISERAIARFRDSANFMAIRFTGR